MNVLKQDRFLNFHFQLKCVYNCPNPSKTLGRAHRRAVYWNAVRRWARPQTLECNLREYSLSPDYAHRGFFKCSDFEHVLEKDKSNLLKTSGHQICNPLQDVAITLKSMSKVSILAGVIDGFLQPLSAMIHVFYPPKSCVNIITVPGLHGKKKKRRGPSENCASG